MKAIFADFDGVLNSIESAVGFHSLKGTPTSIFSEVDRLNPVAIGLLKYLCDATGAKLIISSTWRLNYRVSEFIEIFSKFGWQNAPIIGATGRGGINSCRGDEIKDWLYQHSVTEYVILDDDSDMLPEQLPYFVNTDGARGFTLQDLCKALHIFGVPEDHLEQHAFFRSTKPY